LSDAQLSLGLLAQTMGCFSSSPAENYAAPAQGGKGAAATGHVDVIFL
jgi:hypothetical protein